MGRNIYTVIICMFLAYTPLLSMETNPAQHEKELQELLQNKVPSSFIHIDPNCDNEEQDYTDFFDGVCNALASQQRYSLINVIGINAKTNNYNIPKKSLALFAQKLNLPILVLPEKEPDKGQLCHIIFYNPRLDAWHEKTIFYGGSLPS